MSLLDQIALAPRLEIGLLPASAMHRISHAAEGEPWLELGSMVPVDVKPE